MKYDKDKVTKLLALRGLELLEWRGNMSAGITYKKLKDASIHSNNYPLALMITIERKYPNEYNKIVYGIDAPIIPCEDIKHRLRNFITMEYNGSRHAEDAPKSKLICLSCNTPFEHHYDKIKQNRAGCSVCGCYEDMAVRPMEILKDCKVIKDPDVDENTYWINDKGIVYSTIGRFKEIVGQKQDSGHISIGVGRNKRDSDDRYTWKYKKMVHRLVLEAFGFPQPSPLHIVRHKNDIPDDNRLDNLQWGLKVDNSKDMEVNFDDRKNAIKKLYSNGASISDLSVACKLSEDMVKAMVL